MISLLIDGEKVSVQEGTSVLEAARKINIDIPTLCYMKGLNEIGACRVCIVEIEGSRLLQPSCTTPVAEGMIVKTHSPKVIEARKFLIEMLLSNHPFDCLTCPRNLNCELQTLAEKYNINDIKAIGERNKYPIDNLSPSLVREPSKCIVCRRCVRVCKDVQEVGIYQIVERGFGAVASPAFQKSLVDTPCITCGQCIMVCPTAAIHGKDDTDQVWSALANPNTHVIIQTAPSIRATLGEDFGMPVGTLVTGKMVAALKKLGFNKVFDDCFGADIVVMEEGNELLHRLENDGPLPQFTSCCPGWVKFAENFYPEIIPHMSSCKSPQQVFGALTKTYYAQKFGINPHDIFSVSVMPCVAKKFEASRPEMNSSGQRDVDVVLTTRELAQMLRTAGIDLNNVGEEEFDSPMGFASGAGVIFGGSGGVMEAVLRTVYEKLSGKPLEIFQMKQIETYEKVKEAEIDLGNGQILKVAACRTTGEARRLLDRIKSGQVQYHFIEVMACPAGCLGGGGQPIYPDMDKWDKQEEFRASRGVALKKQDKLKEIRKAHENPHIKKIYDEFLEYPLSDISKKLLHTQYVARELYPVHNSKEELTTHGQQKHK